jgi:hypothetical protein
VPANAIRSVSFRPVAADDGAEGGHALVMALELGAPDQLLGFLEDVITRFKHERLTGPVDAHYMLISLTGAIPARDFATAWRSATANDAPAHALLGAMHRADVVASDGSGQASLISAERG